MFVCFCFAELQILQRSVFKCCEQLSRLAHKHTNTSPRCMSRIVDAWAQPPESSHLEAVPEVKRLLMQSNVPPEMMDMVGQIGPKEFATFVELAGIEKVLLSAWHRPGRVCISNEQVMKFTSAYPDIFIGIGSVDLARPMKALAEMEKFVKEYGFKGVRILPWIWEKPPTHNLLYPIFAKCVKLDIPFCTQVVHTGPLCPSEPGRPVPYIDQVARLP